MVLENLMALINHGYITDVSLANYYMSHEKELNDISLEDLLSKQGCTPNIPKDLLIDELVREVVEPTPIKVVEDDVTVEPTPIKVVEDEIVVDEGEEA